MADSPLRSELRQKWEQENTAEETLYELSPRPIKTAKKDKGTTRYAVRKSSVQSQAMNGKLLTERTEKKEEIDLRVYSPK